MVENQRWSSGVGAKNTVRSRVIGCACPNAHTVAALPKLFWSIKSSFHWNEKVEPNPWKITPQHIPSATKVYLTQCSQKSTVLLVTAKPKLIHQITRLTIMTRYSREYITTALNSSGGMLSTTASSAFHCTWWCDDIQSWSKG